MTPAFRVKGFKVKDLWGVQVGMFPLILTVLSRGLAFRV